LKALVAGKKTLTDDERAAIKDLDNEREQTIADLAHLVFNSVRPATAEKPRHAGQFLNSIATVRGATP
jgi:hypothetical protein